MKQTNVLKIAVALVFMAYQISTQAQTLTMDAEFILSKDAVERNSWERIKNGYKVLKRYDLSVKDIDKNNIVVYP